VIAIEGHALIDFRRAGIPLREHEESLVDHRQQNIVDDETGRSLTVIGDLSRERSGVEAASA
jgi:metallophosphoesterase superfamily enzyme